MIKLHKVFEASEDQTLRLNQSFTAKATNGTYFHGRVNEIQQESTYAVTIKPFYEISQSANLINLTFDLEKPPSHIKNTAGKWRSTKAQPPQTDYHIPTLINLYDNLMWNTDSETLFGKVYHLTIDPESHLPLIEVALYDDKTKMRTFIYKNGKWQRYNYDPTNKKFSRVGFTSNGQITDKPLGSLFRAEAFLSRLQGKTTKTLYTRPPNIKTLPSIKKTGLKTK